MSSEQKKIRLTTALDAVSLLASLFACGACVENVAPAFPLVFLAMTLFAALLDMRGCGRPPRIVINLMSMAILAVLALRLRYNYIFEALIEALLLMLGVELLEKRTLRGWSQILGISFALPVACTAVSVGKSFLFYAAGSAVLCSTGLTLLLWLRRDENAVVAPNELWQLFKRSFTIFAIALPAAVFIFFAAPRAAAPMFGMRGRYSSAATGFADEVQLGAADEIETSRALAFRVEVEELPATPYWRGKILDVFTGASWLSSNIPADQGGYEPEPKTKRYRQTFYLEPSFSSRALFALDRPLGLSGIDAEDQGGATYAAAGYSRARRLRYEAVSIVSRKLRPSDAGFDKRRYLRYPKVTMPRLEALTAGLTAGKSSRQKIDAIMNYLAPPRFAYSLSGLSRSANALEDFVFNSRSGSCEYFASAMGTMLRMAGVPARLVGGYRGGVYNEAGGYYSVLDENAHVWVEAWDDGEKAWLRCDPTPAGVDFGLSQSQTIAGMYLDYLDYQWSRLVLGYSWELQASAVGRLKSALSSPASTLPKAENTLSSFVKMMRLPVLSCVFIAVLSWLVGKLLKLRKRRPEEALLAQYDAIMKRSGFRRGSCEGLEEFAARINEIELRELTMSFARIFEEKYFADQPFDRQTQARLKTVIAKIKKSEGKIPFSEK